MSVSTRPWSGRICVSVPGDHRAAQAVEPGPRRLPGDALDRLDDLDPLGRHGLDESVRGGQPDGVQQAPLSLLLVDRRPGLQQVGQRPGAACSAASAVFSASTAWPWSSISSSTRAEAIPVQNGSRTWVDPAPRVLHVAGRERRARCRCGPARTGRRARSARCRPAPRPGRRRAAPPRGCPRRSSPGSARAGRAAGSAGPARSARSASSTSTGSAADELAELTVSECLGGEELGAQDRQVADLRRLAARPAASLRASTGLPARASASARVPSSSSRRSGATPRALHDLPHLAAGVVPPLRERDVARDHVPGELPDRVEPPRVAKLLQRRAGQRRPVCPVTAQRGRDRLQDLQPRDQDRPLAEGAGIAPAGRASRPCATNRRRSTSR